MRLEKQTNGTWTSIKSAPALPIRPRAVNTLAVTGDGAHYTVAVNNRVVLQADDAELTGGSPGVAVELANPGDQGTWDFSQFDVYNAK